MTLPNTDLATYGLDSQPTGHCTRCVQDVPLSLSRSGPHIKGCCSICGAYVRFVEQPGRMPFGRYRGQPVAQVPHDYLTWLRRTPEAWARLSRPRQRAIEETLREILP